MDRRKEKDYSVMDTSWKRVSIDSYEWFVKPNATDLFTCQITAATNWVWVSRRDILRPDVYVNALLSRIKDDYLWITPNDNDPAKSTVVVTDCTENRDSLPMKAINMIVVCDDPRLKDVPRGAVGLWFINKLSKNTYVSVVQNGELLNRRSQAVLNATASLRNKIDQSQQMRMSIRENKLRQQQIQDMQADVERDLFDRAPDIAKGAKFFEKQFNISRVKLLSDIERVVEYPKEYVPSDTIASLQYAMKVERGPVKKRELVKAPKKEVSAEEEWKPGKRKILS